MVFDIKQTVRARQDTFAFLEEFKGQIRHLHISDNSRQGDCLPPGKGNFDFIKLKDIMDAAGYEGDAVIEIYSGSYDVFKELEESKTYLNRLWQKGI